MGHFSGIGTLSKKMFGTSRSKTPEQERKSDKERYNELLGEGTSPSEALHLIEGEKGRRKTEVREWRGGERGERREKEDGNSILKGFGKAVMNYGAMFPSTGYGRMGDFPQYSYGGGRDVGIGFEAFNLFGSSQEPQHKKKHHKKQHKQHKGNQQQQGGKHIHLHIG